MRLESVFGLVVAAFALSLPVMYFTNKEGDVADAAAEADEDKDDPVVDALNLKGLMYLGNGQTDKAIAVYSDAIKRDPKYSFSYLGRGDAYAVKGDLQRALADYETAARVDPHNDAATDRVKLLRAELGQK
jgi:tetratricopeptide (TPR) repeat protein